MFIVTSETTPIHRFLHEIIDGSREGCKSSTSHTAPFGPVFAANTPPVKHPADSVFFQSCLALYYNKRNKEITCPNASILTLSIKHSDPL